MSLKILSRHSGCLSPCAEERTGLLAFIPKLHWKWIDTASPEQDYETVSGFFTEVLKCQFNLTSKILSYVPSPTTTHNQSALTYLPPKGIPLVSTSCLLVLVTGKTDSPWISIDPWPHTTAAILWWVHLQSNPSINISLDTFTSLERSTEVVWFDPDCNSTPGVGIEHWRGQEHFKQTSHLDYITAME